MRPFVVTVLPLVLLVPAASRGQEPPHPTAAFECGVNHTHDGPHVAPEYQRIAEPSVRTSRVDVLVLNGNPNYDPILVELDFRDVARYFAEADSGIELRLVGIERPPADMTASLARMRGATDATWRRYADAILERARTSEAVDRLRRRYGADLVHIRAPKPTALPGIYGYADLPSRLARSRGFSVISGDIGRPAVLAHELGHNFGLAHQRDGSPLRSYGRPYIGQFGSGRSYSTIMANPRVGLTLPAFSRAGGYNQGNLIGDATADSARALRAVAHTVAGYEAEKSGDDDGSPPSDDDDDDSPPTGNCTSGRTGEPIDCHTTAADHTFAVQYHHEGEWKWANIGVASGDSAVFHFFGPDNLEVFAKVLNGCRIDGTVWVYASGLTDLPLYLTVWPRRDPSAFNHFPIPDGGVLRPQNGGRLDWCGR